MGSLILLCLSLFFSTSIKCSDQFYELFNQANKLHYKQKFNEAIEVYRQALHLQPDHPQALFNLGITLDYCNQLDEAIEAYKKALFYNPSYTKAYTHLIEACLKTKKNDELKTHIKEALTLIPDDIAHLERLAFACIEYDDLDQGAQLYQHIVTKRPENEVALNNYAYVLTRINQPAQSIIYYQQLLTKLDSTQARLGLSKALLACGDFAQGWHEFECRFPDRAAYQKEFGYYNLKPQDLKNKRVLLRAEWGFGDMIQFIRYAQLIKQEGAKQVLMQTFEALVPLFSRCPFIDYVFAVGDPIPDAHVHIPLLSLPMIFNTNIDTIPADIPYLTADPTLIEYWKQQLQHDTHFKIGLCWHAKPIYIEDHKHTRRSIPIKEFLPLSSLSNVSFYSLQKEFGLDELNSIKNEFPIHDFGNEFDKTHGRFMDTAAVIKNLDLIMCADTSIVHIAGALGSKVWLLLPYAAEWRWLPGHPDYGQASITPWYPNNVRLFRQKEPGNWTSVIHEIKNELEKEIAKKSADLKKERQSL